MDIREKLEPKVVQWPNPYDFPKRLKDNAFILSIIPVALKIAVEAYRGKEDEESRKALGEAMLEFIVNLNRTSLEIKNLLEEMGNGTV